MKCLEKITGGYSSSAKVVDGALVLSLPDAVSPVVWRMELDDVKAAALEISQKDNFYMLTLKEGKAEKKEIAPFDNKAKAVKALMAASSALENAHSMSKSREHITAAANANTSGKGSNMVSALIALLILGALIFGLSRMSPNVQTAADLSGSNTGQVSTAPQQGSPGTPQSADDFLMGR